MGLGLMVRVGLFLAAWAMGINIIRWFIYPIISIGLNDAGCAWALLGFIVVYTVCITCVFINARL